MKRHSILSVALNPALDLTLSVSKLKLGEVNLATSSFLHPAGKGLNVARVAKDLGCQVAVCGFLGLDNSAPFQDICRQVGINDYFQIIPGATRTNVKISESNQLVTDVNAPGITITPAAWEDFKNSIKEVAGQYEAIVLTGSLPKGLSKFAYFELMESLKPLSRLIFLDSSGEALAAAIPGKPYLIKPNLMELSEWAKESITSPQKLLVIVKKLLDKGIAHIVVSNGSHGCYWFNQDFAIAATTPKVEVVSTVGAGDSMVAALTYGILSGLPENTNLTKACAIAAHAVEQVGVGVKNLDRIQDIQQQISVKPFDNVESL